MSSILCSSSRIRFRSTSEMPEAAVDDDKDGAVAAAAAGDAGGRGGGSAEVWPPVLANTIGLRKERFAQ